MMSTRYLWNYIQNKWCLSRNRIIFVKYQDFKGCRALDVLHKKEYFVYMCLQRIYIYLGFRRIVMTHTTRFGAKVTLFNLSLNIYFNLSIYSLVKSISSYLLIFCCEGEVFYGNDGSATGTDWHSKGALEKEDFLRVRPPRIQGRILMFCGVWMDGCSLGVDLAEWEIERERERERERETERVFG